MNYLHWIEDLLLKADVDPFQSESGKPVSGIDVGTGANCIYALLGAKLNGWRFIATEIDERSFAAAMANVQRNALETQITVKRTSTNDLLAEPLADVSESESFDFVMCNPPFFEDMSEADTNPESCCMGSANEMVFPGGEVAFISRMIDDSLALQDRVLWFTSLIGRKSSLRKLLLYLREKKVPTMCSTEFFQGRTKRWGIAWTFRANMKLDPSVCLTVEAGYSIYYKSYKCNCVDRRKYWGKGRKQRENRNSLSKLSHPQGGQVCFVE